MNTDLIDKAIDEYKGVWPEFIPDGRVLCHTETHGFCQGHHDTDYVLANKDEFEARVAERQGKPSWDDVPDWVTHSAQNSAGWWLWFECKFEACSTHWVSGSSHIEASSEQRGEVIIPWQDTLEKRPEVDVSEKARFVNGDFIPKECISNAEVLSACSAVAVDKPRDALSDYIHLNKAGCKGIYINEVNGLRYAFNVDNELLKSHTLSEWLFKTAPDWAVDVKFLSGRHLWTDGKSKGCRFMDIKTREEGNSNPDFVRAIATRDPEPTPVKDHPLKDEIEKKLNSGELVINGAAESYTPEVGEECEFRFRSVSSSWSKCECLGIDNEYVWIRKSGIPGGGSVHSWGSIEFRPIQSPRQQFVQAAMVINNRMIDADMNDTSLIFGAVFDELVGKSE